MISWPLSNDQLQQPFVVTRGSESGVVNMLFIFILHMLTVSPFVANLVLCSDDLIGLLIGYSFQSLHRVHERAQDQGDAQRDEERDACR